MMHAVLLSLVVSFGCSNLWAMDQRTEQTTLRRQFFSDVMGVEEKAFKLFDEEEQEFISEGSEESLSKRLQLLQERIRRNTDGSFAIVGRDGQLFQCGRCMELPLKSMRGRAYASEPIRFSVIEACDFSTQSIACVDIGALQADPSNKRAVFQVASNFNGLETRGCSDEMSEIGMYIFDRTQGPLASISAAPGLIFRHYYYFYEQRIGQCPDLWRQRGQQSPNNVDELGILQLNLLDGLGVVTQNGYVVDGVDKLREFERPDGSLNSGYFKILYHQGIQVTFGGVQNLFPAPAASTQTICSDPSQIIDQIFTAALCLAHSGGSVAPGVGPVHAQFDLDCLYEATLRAAAIYGTRINGRVKVFLTRMGGGAFGNPQNMIDTAIIRAVNLPDLQNSGLDVILNNFRMISYEGGGSRDGLLTLVKATHGSYTIFVNGDGENIAQ